jgi:hypothetical protein
MPTDKSGSANASRSISKFVNGLRKEHEGISVLKKKEVEDWAKTLLQLYRIALCHEEEGESLAQFAAGIESLYVATVGKHAKVPFVSLHGVKLDDINDIFEETMEFLPLYGSRFVFGWNRIGARRSFSNGNIGALCLCGDR